MIDFVVVSSDLWPYVLDTRVKRGAELSTDHHLRGELDPLAEEEVGQTWQTQTYCEGLLGTSPGRALCQGTSHLQKSFSQIPREAGDIESEWTMFSASIVDAFKQFEAVDTRSLVPVMAATPNPVVDTGIDRYRQVKQAAARTVLEAKTPGLGGVRAGGELLTSTEDIVGRWKKYFEDLLNPTDLPSNEEAEAGNSEVDSSITQAEVTEVVCKLLIGKVPGVDEIRPEYLKSLDVVGLSWLTRLCNIAWWLGTVPLKWQTGMVVPLFKKGTGECSKFQLQGIIARVLERRFRPIVNPRIQEEQCGFRPLVVEHWTSSIPSTGCLRVYGSLPNQSTCALWIWRRHSTVSLVVFCGECSHEYIGVRGLC
ncbi:hypothetical protein L3Q82_001686 [Scortum barcoo]|uniref:Uncharacterized protein n=1 Tax=Scortum barcoo TaxID=214431 RepID=A0ACB8W3M7_9TELE|nr:hypothetical protein L3Q82_001686 [Scortum barcoo]